MFNPPLQSELRRRSEHLSAPTGSSFSSKPRDDPKVTTSNLCQNTPTPTSTPAPHPTNLSSLDPSMEVHMSNQHCLFYLIFPSSFFFLIPLFPSVLIWWRNVFFLDVLHICFLCLLTFLQGPFFLLFLLVIFAVFWHFLPSFLTISLRFSPILFRPSSVHIKHLYLLSLTIVLFSHFLSFLSSFSCPSLNIFYFSLFFLFFLTFISPFSSLPLLYFYSIFLMRSQTSFLLFPPFLFCLFILYIFF